MWKKIGYECRIAVCALGIFSLLFGGLYPLLVWGVAKVLFPTQADGSLIYRQGELRGSQLIAQGISADIYFHPRPSAVAYDGANSNGSHFGPLAAEWLTLVEQRVQTYRQVNGLDPTTPVPSDSVTASGSGLDPHISLKNAELQLKRVAQARKLHMDEVKGLLLSVVEQPLPFEKANENSGIVNVWTINLLLDERYPVKNG